MATNRRYAGSNNVWPNVKVTAQTASRTSNHALANDPVVCGQKAGVALDDADSNGLTRMQVDGIFSLLVAGIDSSGTSGADANVTVLGGDIVYFDPAKTPPVSKRAGGIRFGYAAGNAGATLVSSGATTTEIDVAIGF
jgi:hypothetical protein